MAASCKQLFVDPTIWLRWSISRRQQHLESFLSFIPRSYQKYEKSSVAGLGQKRRGNLPEANVFVDKVRGNIDHSSFDSHATASLVTTLKDKKQKNRKAKSDHWEIVNKNKVPTVDIFNPNRVTSKIYRLVHKSGKSSFQTSVKRWEECKVSFTAADVIAVKITALREYTNKLGKLQKSSGNVYLHYLKTCLTGHDQKFEFNQINVPVNTKEELSNEQIPKLSDTGCVFEDM